MDNCNTAESKLKSATGIILNNWYALKVALDHGQGGPPAVQHGKIESLLNSITSMVMSLSHNGDSSDISDYLGDFMDDEFDIVLEDDSQIQVVQEVCDFYKLIISGTDDELLIKLDKLPNKTSILSRPVRNVPLQIDEDSSTDGDEDDDMDQDDPDPGWTVVKHKGHK